MERVELRPARPEEAPILANLLELYCHDLSAYFPVEIGTDGRYGYRHLPRYFSEPAARFAFLTLLDGKLAGFALATVGSTASERASDLDVAEFFVLKRLRRRGVGERAAALLWNQLRGRWIVRVAVNNTSAIAFWRGAIAGYTDQTPHERRQVLDGIERIVFELDSR